MPTTTVNRPGQSQGLNVGLPHGWQWLNHRVSWGGGGEGEGTGRKGGRDKDAPPVIREREDTTPRLRERTLPRPQRKRERRRSPSHQRERSLSPRSETERCFPNLREGDPPEKMLPRSQRERKDAPQTSMREAPPVIRERRCSPRAQREREDAYPVIKNRDGERERKALPRVLASHPRTQSIHLCCRCKLR